MLFWRPMCNRTGSALLEALEGRRLLSGGAAAAGTAAGRLRSDAAAARDAPVVRSTVQAAAKKRASAADSAPLRYVVGFYGLGGPSFGNSWLAQTVSDVGANEGATTRIYQQDQGQQAVADYFAFVDANGDH